MSWFAQLAFPCPAPQATLQRCATFPFTAAMGLENAPALPEECPAEEGWHGFHEFLYIPSDWSQMVIYNIEIDAWTRLSEMFDRSDEPDDAIFIVMTRAVHIQPALIVDETGRLQRIYLPTSRATSPKYFYGKLASLNSVRIIGTEEVARAAVKIQTV